MPAAPRLLRSVAAVALAMSATSIAYVGSAAPARAAGYNGYCTSSSGVTVAVDFGALGGGIAIRCAPVGAGATGVDALNAAGIPVQGTRRYGLAFVCRIYGKPSASATLPGGYHEGCVNTPPTNAHWDYYQASNGGSWSYSGAGAGSSHVRPGGFEGWSFTEGSKAAPRVRPSRPVAAPPKPKPTATHTMKRAAPRHTTTTAAPPRTTSGHRAAKKSTASGASSHASPSSSSTARHNRASSSSSTAVAGTSSGNPTAAAVGAKLANSNDLIKQSDKSSGLNATTVVGGVVLAVLVVGGAAVAIIRRRSLG